MIRTDEGRRFSDDTYASKEEVQAVYNVADISGVWNRILTYRSFFDEEIELLDIDHNHYKICLTKKLIAEGYSMERRAMAYQFELMNLTTMRPTFYIEKAMRSLYVIAHFLSLDLNSSMAKKIASGETEAVPPQFFCLQAYTEALNSIPTLKKFNLESIHTIQKLASGNTLESEVIYRKSDENKYLPYPLVQADKIDEHFSALFRTLEDDMIPLFLRAMILMYFFHVVMPYEEFNEITAALSAKAFLYLNGYKDIAFSFDFESLAFSHSDNFYQAIKLCQKTLDVTYYIVRTMPFLKAVSKDDQMIIDKLKMEDGKNLVKTNISRLDQNAFQPSNELALPALPKSGNALTIEQTALKLMEVHPHLKKKQAHFYAGHCTIGLHYTIDQFKECEGSVYETARTSMEDLAARGFYKKEQIGKKFVYTPIPQKDTDL